MDLSKFFSPHKAQPDGAAPPAVDPPLEPTTLAMPRMAAGMVRSNPAGTGTHPAGPAVGATQTHLAGPPASHRAARAVAREPKETGARLKEEAHLQ